MAVIVMSVGLLPHSGKPKPAVSSKQPVALGDAGAHSLSQSERRQAGGTAGGTRQAAGIRHTPISYRVGPNDTLDSVAASFNVSAEQIRWSNLQELRSTAEVDAGETLTIPPVPGVVVSVRPGETLHRLAAVWQVKRETIQDFNGVRDPGRELRPGKLLVLPAARVPKLPESRSLPPSLPAAPGAPPGVVNLSGPDPGGASYDIFPSGQCTYYVASRITVPWNGDAWTWYESARSYGWVVGSVPRQGAIIVTGENAEYGHVAYVEHVYSDGSLLVSEMNYAGEGVIDQRLIGHGGVPLIGFIYPPGTLG